MRGYVGGALFGGAVDVNADVLSMPMQLLGGIGVVEDIDPGAPPLLEPQQRTGN